MFTKLARRCVDLFLLVLLASSAWAAPSAPTGVSTSVPNLSKAVAFTGWMSFCNRYERQQSATVVTAAKPQIKAYTCNMYAGGAPVAFGVNTTLTLTLDGTPVAASAVKATDTSVTFNVNLDAVPENWYLASIQGLDGSWSVLDYGVYVLKGGKAQPHGVMPVTTASHELAFDGEGRYQQAWVPTKFAPVTVPYPARTFPPISTVPRRKDLVMTSLAVARPDDLYRPALTKEGVWTTANLENYFFSTFEQAKPILPMLDGPRGRGSIIAPVHLEVGTAAPNGVLRGNVYFIESWRIGKVTPDGTVVTLAGWRHKDIASYYNDPTSAELVGDWSAIPPSRHGFAQPWGMAWDPRTLTINEMAAPIPTEGNEKPHIFGPTLYVSDTYHNRVVKIEFSATSHSVPPKVTEFATGLNEPWDVIAVGVQLYVSDRKNHAIKVFDMDTGALVKSIPVVQPEGMAYLDGWLYYGSVLTKSIRKINLATGQQVLIADPSIPAAKFAYYIDDNSRYMKIAVSDGSFGPRGMIAYTTWSNRNFGYPNLIDGNTGAAIDYLSLKSGETFRGTNPLRLKSYATAVGIGAGRMLFGTAEEGLHVASAALPSDPIVDQKKYTAGMDQWQARGYNLTHGPAGYGYYGLPVPWGDTPEIDYFLKANLHGDGLPPGGGTPGPGGGPPGPGGGPPGPGAGTPPPGGGTPAATVTASTSTAAFGNVTVGRTSAAKTIVISNTGAAAATNMAYPAAPAKFAKSGTCSGNTLNAGATCTIVFTYSPTTAVQDNATYTVTGGGATISIALSGTGVPVPTPSVSASPLSLAFGNVTVGKTSGAQAIVVSNTGTANATNMTYPAAPANFTRSGTCSGATLTAGTSCTVVFTFKPTASGNASATYTITGAGRTMSIALSGTGTAAPTASLSANPGSLAFGTLATGTSSAAQSITVANEGSAPANALSMASNNALEFKVSDNTCGTKLDPGATCQLTVAYAPTAAGFDVASIVFGYTGGSLTVPMSGTGEDPASAQASGKLSMPSSLDLANVTLGLATSPTSVSIANNGSTPVAVTSIASSNAGEFSISGSTCATLAPGASCTFKVTFSPFWIGTRAATITVTSNAPGSPQSLQVSGAGLSGSAVPAPPPGAAAAIEYYHADFDHYFFTAGADEIAKLDAGVFEGWVRTGRQFNVHSAPAAGRRTACRFFSTAFSPRSSHFYTPDAGECSTVRGNPDWQFEGEVFYTMAPAADGTCAAGTKPVYRMYNNGQGGAPNHRYTTEASVRALMLAQGWIAEGYGPVGVIMCAPQ
jgi:hypothetical protein